MADSDDELHGIGSFSSSDEEAELLLEDRPTVNPDTFEDLFPEIDDHWLSEDQLFDLQTARDNDLKVPPALSTWELCKETAAVELTVAKARRMAWEQGKAEIELHKKNVQLLPTSGSSGIDNVYQHTFGSKSRLCRLFMDKLGISSEELRFIVTYFKSCRYKMSVPSLHSSDDTFSLLMPSERYNVIWKDIVALPRHAHGQSFWQELESLLNGVLADLFMESAVEQLADGDELSTFIYHIGLDDDKLHYAWGKGTKSDGLKRGHHVKDNRHGFTAYTACHAATAAPLNVSFQRQNETVRSTQQRE